MQLAFRNIPQEIEANSLIVKAISVIVKASPSKIPSYIHVYSVSVRTCMCARTSVAKDCSQNANLHRPLMDMGVLEKC
jgi:hypothetical protein